jgi:hypothetical protein
MKIGKSDWSRYYRQVAKPPSEYWHQVIWSQQVGCNYDKSVTFGDGAGHVEHMLAQILLCNNFGRNIPLGWLRSEPELLRLGQQA